MRVRIVESVNGFGLGLIKLYPQNPNESNETKTTDDDETTRSNLFSSKLESRKNPLEISFCTVVIPLLTIPVFAQLIQLPNNEADNLFYGKVSNYALCNGDKCHSFSCVSLLLTIPVFAQLIKPFLFKIGIQKESSGNFLLKYSAINLLTSRLLRCIPIQYSSL